MIKIENVESFGWNAAIRGARNPMNSWDKGDSRIKIYESEDGESIYEFGVGENDLKLAERLSAAGTDHGKFMRMIHVQVDVVAPLYWWKEFDTYKVGTVANSCSTMHKIQSKKFERSDFSCEHLNGCSLCILDNVIAQLNRARNTFNYGDKNKDDWWQMIQLLPTSYNQRRTIDLNYAVLKNIYHSRKNHKLDEWIDFCKWIESLPCSELITGK